MVSKKQVEKMSRKLYNNRDKKELYFMTNSIYTEIKKRIKLAESGTVFFDIRFYRFGYNNNGKEVSWKAG